MRKQAFGHRRCVWVRAYITVRIIYTGCNYKLRTPRAKTRKLSISGNTWFVSYNWKSTFIISAQNVLREIQREPRHISSWTAASVHRWRSSCGQSDRHPQCDVSLRCQQELHTQGLLGVPTGKNPEDSNLAGVETMQWALLYLSVGQDRCYWEHLAQRGAPLWLPVVQLPVASADHVRRNLGSGFL
jgi:hypothetical protein